MNGRIVALIVALVLLPLVVAAATPPSAEEIATKLNGAARSWGSDRGITNTKGGPDGVAAIDLTINFEFNSATLTPDGLVLAGNLGRALKDSRLAGQRFRIEGHTDAVGGDAFNHRLSLQRAEAVRHHLISVDKVEASRLEVVGHGESRLLDPTQPTSGVNRRVRVVNLGKDG